MSKLKVSQDGAQFYCECGCGALIWQAPFKVKDFDSAAADEARNDFFVFMAEERDVDERDILFI